MSVLYLQESYKKKCFYLLHSIVTNTNGNLLNHIRIICEFHGCYKISRVMLNGANHLIFIQIIFTVRTHMSMHSRELLFVQSKHGTPTPPI